MHHSSLLDVFHHQSLNADVLHLSVYCLLHLHQFNEMTMSRMSKYVTSAIIALD